MERIPARMTMGIDIGSTTVKIIIVKNGDVVYQQYERHMSQVRPKTLELIRMAKDVIGGGELTVALSGSAGLGVAKAAGLPFIQEVFATGEVVKSLAPRTPTVVIELGGEDAKIIFFTGGLEERMNGSCAGGTGAFIDQMATLLDVTPGRARHAQPAAAKSSIPSPRAAASSPRSDIQPLLNQGARKEDIAASHLPGGRRPDDHRPGAGAADRRARCSFWAARCYYLQGPAAASSSSTLRPLA